jgi:hypothetical protein
VSTLITEVKGWRDTYRLRCMDCRHNAGHEMVATRADTLNLAAAKFVRQGYTAVIRCERCQGLMELTAGEVVIQDREGPRRSGVGANKGADSPRWGAFNADMRRDGAPSTSRGGV